MHPTFEATLHVIRTSLNDLLAVIDDMPGEALDWTPAEGVNSVTVLTRHSLTAIIFLGGTAAGTSPDRRAYLSGERAAAFSAKDTAAASLRAEVAATLATTAANFEHGSDGALAAPASWAWPDGRTPTGAELLVHSAGHLKEHVGQASLLRDLWSATGRTS